MADADIGLIGLAVMGQNLALNMDEHGFRVAVYNRTVSKVDDFLAGPAAGTRIVGTHCVEELVAALSQPRKVMLMVRAGEVVDQFIDALVPLLRPRRRHHRRGQLPLPRQHPTHPSAGGARHPVCRHRGIRW